VIQRGLGAGSSTAQLPTTSADASVVDVNSAVDAASGEVVASWQSLANPGGLYMQGVTPTLGAPQLTPGELRSELEVAGRDSGPGVYAAYTPDGTHARLARYGGGTVAVGSLPGVSARVLGVATGIDGRIWVLWGDDNAGLAVTRSNKAVTRFEPIQHLNPNAFSLYRLFGDGRLGPLDLLVQELPNFTGSVPPPGAFYARVLPVLSASVSVKAVKSGSGAVVAHKLLVTVTDAGDAVGGATVSAKGQHKKTSAQGVAKVTVPGAGGRVTVTITSPGYQALTKRVKLS
jgi:hypothetical protein